MPCPSVGSRRCWPQPDRRSVTQQESTILEALGNIGDFIGGIGVVLTLIYLAAQVRQNTTALKTASRQAIVAGAREYNRLGFQPGGDAFRMGAKSYPDVSPDVRRYYTAQMNDLLLFFQGAHALYESGTLEDETYEKYLDWVAANMATPGGAKLWGHVREIYTPRMVAALDARLERGDLPDLFRALPEGSEPAA